MDFILSLFFILIILIFSGVFRTLLSKSIKKNLDQGSSNEDDEQLIYNNNTVYEEEVRKNEEKKETNLIELFEEYSLKKKNEVYNKNAYINRNTIYLNERQKDERKKEKEEKIHNRKLKQKEVLQSKKRETFDSLGKKINQEDITLSLDKKLALERIKKLSYFKQAIVLSEILGTPKGLDL